MTSEEVARRFVDAWYGVGDLRDVVAEGFVHHAPAADLDLAAYDAQLTLIRAALTEPEWRVEHLVADGGLVAVYVSFAGTHSGELFGIEPTGRRVTTAGASFVRVENDRVAEDWDVWALQSLVHQLS